MGTITCMMDYLPTTAHAVSAAQETDRNEVLDFMDGCVSASLSSRILGRVKELAGTSGRDCVIGFIPGPTRAVTMLRFGRLADRLSTATGIPAFMDVIGLKCDSDPIVQEVELLPSRSRVEGKHVIMIGSIYDTGAICREVADMLDGSGASEVDMVFVARVARS